MPFADANGTSSGRTTKCIRRRNSRLIDRLLCPAEEQGQSWSTSRARSLTWSGPKNDGDSLTFVPKGLPDGRYAAYADASKGSPVTIKAPAEAGPAEIRYMSGQGARVLARRALTVAAP